MKVDLDKKGLVALVKGYVPHYDVMNHALVTMTGHYIGGFHDRWEWDNESLEKLTEKNLFKLYNTCKDSWEDDK